MERSWPALHAEVTCIGERWRAQRPERQARRSLDPDDFAELASAGFLLVGAPAADGGLWTDVAHSTRPLCELLRCLAAADPSVALVSAMHPAVLGYWLIPVPDHPTDAWASQRAAVLATARAGEQWGTITSEPGSGGDILRTKTVARPEAARPGPSPGALPGRPYRLWGEKHFGSGSGVTAFMVTTAKPDDESEPSIYIIDTRGRAWDGSAGMRLHAAWDGMGMAATQSHAMLLEGCPAVRMAWDAPIGEVMAAVAPFIPLVFTAVLLGVLDEAVATAKANLAPRSASLRAYEQVEWSRAELEHWLAVQAWDGAVRAVESGDRRRGAHAALRAKEAVAELSESVLRRLSRVIGGATFSRRSPFAVWFEDVRALGFLRPPWGLAFDNLFATSFD